jgi:hypothetical protein
LLLVLDLSRIALADGKVRPEEKKIIELTGKMLKMSKSSMDLLRKLAQLIFSQESKSINELLNSEAGGRLRIDTNFLPYLLQDIPDWQKVVKVKKRPSPLKAKQP